MHLQAASRDKTREPVGFDSPEKNLFVLEYCAAPNAKSRKGGSFFCVGGSEGL